MDELIARLRESGKAEDGFDPAEAVRRMRSGDNGPCGLCGEAAEALERVTRELRDERERTECANGFYLDEKARADRLEAALRRGLEFIEGEYPSAGTPDGRGGVYWPAVGPFIDELRRALAGGESPTPTETTNEKG